MGESASVGHSASAVFVFCSGGDDETASFFVWLSTGSMRFPKDCKHQALPELGILVPWISLSLVQPYWIHNTLLLQLRKAIILDIKSITLLFLNFNSGWQLFGIGIFITRKTLSHDSRILSLVYFYRASNNEPIWH